MYFKYVLVKLEDCYFDKNQMTMKQVEYYDYLVLHKNKFHIIFEINKQFRKPSFTVHYNMF